MQYRRGWARGELPSSLSLLLAFSVLISVTAQGAHMLLSLHRDSASHRDGFCHWSSGQSWYPGLWLQPLLFPRHITGRPCLAFSPVQTNEPLGSIFLFPGVHLPYSVPRDVTTCGWTSQANTWLSFLPSFSQCTNSLLFAAFICPGPVPCRRRKPKQIFTWGKLGFSLGE